MTFRVKCPKCKSDIEVSAAALIKDAATILGSTTSEKKRLANIANAKKPRPSRRKKK
jgi:hypothetical protein